MSNTGNKKLFLELILSFFLVNKCRLLLYCIYSDGIMIQIGHSLERGVFFGFLSKINILFIIQSSECLILRSHGVLICSSQLRIIFFSKWVSFQTILYSLVLESVNKASGIFLYLVNALLYCIYSDGNYGIYRLLIRGILRFLSKMNILFILYSWRNI